MWQLEGWILEITIERGARSIGLILAGFALYTLIDCLPYFPQNALNRRLVQVMQTVQPWPGTNTT
ncbi:MAG: hypothetical protein HY846_05265 [Nitrosomonadales bacterium]|nr:hypothetical protein [Nitrosomonadales bacterium]